MFEPNASWSLPAHLFLVSEWSADCTQHERPRRAAPTRSRRCARAARAHPTIPRVPQRPRRAVTRSTRGPTSPTCSQEPRDLGLLRRERHRARLRERRRAALRAGEAERVDTPGIWNPLPWFDTVQDDHQLGNIQSSASFYAAAKDGTLPAVSWVVPSGEVSEHPPAPVQLRAELRDQPHQRGHAQPRLGLDRDLPRRGTTGAASTTTSSRRRSTRTATGCACPAIVISPYAKRGYIDHQTLSFDAYDKFIEDDFLDGAAPRSRHRRPARSATRRARGRDDPRQPHDRLRLQPGAPTAGDPAGPSEDDAHRHAVARRAPDRALGRRVTPPEPGG